MKLRVVGNSHVGALKRGLDRALTQQPTRFESVEVFPIVRAKLELEPFSRQVGNAVELTDPQSRSHLSTRAGVDKISDGAWGVCMGLHNVVLLRDPFWDRHAPAWIANEDEIPVSDSLCQAIVLAGQEHVRAFVLQLQDAGIPAFLIASPPLRRDHPSVAERRAAVPLEVDRLARESLIAFAAQHGIPFVEHPTSSVAEDGFLREEYRSRIVRANGSQDRAHANADYGALMMRRVIDLAQECWA